MLQTLRYFFQSRWYWGAVVAVGASLEAVALFYQHILGEPPCVLCIQARFWVLSGIVVAIVALLIKKPALRLIAHVGLIGSLIMLLNRSWISVLVERGLYEGQCGMDPGFPSWFALDAWFPNVFEVWTMCGYTPNFIFGLSMGEGLVSAAILLLIIAIGSLAINVWSMIQKSKN